MTWKEARKLLPLPGIDARRFWLLMDLFEDLSDRGEMMDQLGRSGVALKAVSWIYGAMSALITLAMVLAAPPPAVFAAVFLGFTAFLLLTVLLSETGNSLINPAEALVLMHQPIDGATYTAAKLSHLVRIVFYLVPAWNAVPALAGLTLRGARWWYPLLHMAAALGIGLVVALLCCALFGWLLRFVPAKRLKAAGQMAGTVPLLAMMWGSEIKKLLPRVDLARWLPHGEPVRWAAAAACGIAALAVVAMGIRSLSADYLIRVSGIVRGGGAAGSKPRRSRVGEIVSRHFGGQTARAGFGFVSRMMLRDWQFRRQLIPLLVPGLVAFAGLLGKGMQTDPFSGRFSPMHVLPHCLGALLCLMCTALPFSSDYKGAWIFALAPPRAIDGMARGTHAVLWLYGIVIPHLLLAPALAWYWGLWHAGLFAAYSLAAASVYLALDLRIIAGAPFTRQLDPARPSVGFIVAVVGAVAMTIAVVVQHFVVFRSPWIVAASAAGLGPVAWFATRSSLGAFADSMRHHLALGSGETGPLYTEVGV